MRSNNHDFDVRVEARLAFAHRRKELLADWRDSDKTGKWALSIIERLTLCNDAEIQFLGGSN